MHAFYGKADKIQVSYGSILYDYTGQRQTANGNMEHLAEYDFMTASTTYDPSATNHRFSFSHVGSMMKFSLGGLEGQTMKKLTLSTYDGSTAFAGNKTSVSLDLGTGSGFLVESGKKLDAYLMMGATTKTVGKNLVLYVTTTGDKNFAILLTGANIDAGKLYTIDATLAEYTFEGEGNSTTPYKINDAGDLTKLAVMTNSGMIATFGKYFQLTDDINMAMGGEAWVPIGKKGNTFGGTFLGGNGSGGNHSISNLPAKSVNNSYAGLFGYLNSATIENVTVNGEITISGANGDAYAGGIAGYARYSTIKGCISSCTIDISGTGGGRAGGIIGYGMDSNVTNCENAGKVSSNDYSGGIIGYAQNNGNITNCTNTGEITSTSTKYPGGGIIGCWYIFSSNQRATLTDCIHRGSAPDPNKAGSIISNYIIGSSASNYSITITNGGSTETPTATPGTEGKWPATDLN